MSGVTNILLVGVGGQGILLASEVLAEVFMRAGYDVKKSEIHGMSQRGGSVVSHLRFGPVVHSPVIPEGEGDILIGFELLETCRFLHLVRDSGRIVSNNQAIFPPSVLLGSEPYPDDLDERIRSRFPEALIVDATGAAIAAGDARAANMVLLGAVSTLLPVEEPVWGETLERMIPARIRALNLSAFMRGRRFHQTGADQ